MAASPQFKVYDSIGEYQASTKRPEEAGAVVSLLGNGATIRHGHNKIVWHEGQESQPAWESFDFLAETVYNRI